MHEAMNQALLQDSFTYHLRNDAECEPLEPISSFGQSSSFEDGSDNSTPTVFPSSGNARLGQPSVQSVALHNTDTFDYRAPTTHTSHDLSFQPGPGISMSTSTSSRGSSSTSPNSACSSFSFLPPHSQYTVNGHVPYNLGAQNAASSYSPSAAYNPSFLQQPFETRPRLTTISLVSGMPPPSRHSTNPISLSPPLASTLRNDYPSSPSRLSRQPFSGHSNPFHLSPSPQSPLSAMSRSLDSASGRGSPASTAHFSFTGPMQVEVGSHLNTNGQNVPPFEPTECFHQLSDDGARPVQPEIHAKIDKGFFRADQDWTCYRRNYFSVACSYGLGAARHDPDHERVCLIRQGSPERILGFYISIAAKVDGEDAKPIELVQHTPKRDKGPMTQPEKKELKPNPSGNLGIYTATTGFGTSQSMTGEYEASYIGGAQESQNVATFERIQFKKATANNGKRRAAQQYFHIVVELYAKVYKNKGSDTEYIKIAHRVSAQMVVRGRSPGHYQDERRTSSTNMGPGSGSSGDYGAHARDPSSAGSSLGSHSSLGGAHYGNRLGHGGYHSHHSAIAYSPSVATSLPRNVTSNLTGSFDQFVETLPTSDMAAEGRTHMEDSHSFQYYGSNASYETHGSTSRSAATSLALTASVPSPAEFQRTTNYNAMSSIKEEPCMKSPFKTENHHRLKSSYGSLQLPVVGKWLENQDHLQPPRDCRPIQLDAHRSYYTAAPAGW